MSSGGLSRPQWSEVSEHGVVVRDISRTDLHHGLARTSHLYVSQEAGWTPETKG